MDTVESFAFLLAKGSNGTERVIMKDNLGLYGLFVINVYCYALCIVMPVTLAKPSMNVTFPAKKSDNTSKNSVLIPQEIIQKAKTGIYLCVVVVAET